MSIDVEEILAYLEFPTTGFHRRLLASPLQRQNCCFSWPIYNTLQLKAPCETASVYTIQDNEEVSFGVYLFVFCLKRNSTSPAVLPDTTTSSLTMTCCCKVEASITESVCPECVGGFAVTSDTRVIMTPSITLSPAKETNTLSILNGVLEAGEKPTESYSRIFAEGV